MQLNDNTTVAGPTPESGPESSGLRVSLNDGLLCLTLDRAAQANALAPQLVEAIIVAFEGSVGARACILRAEGRNFCAGFDLSELDAMSDGDLLWRFLRIETMLQAVHHAPFPVMVFAQGHVIGAGADLFAACSWRVASPDCRFRMPGWNFELALGTRRLAALVGRDHARNMLIDSAIIDAVKAETMGLASAIQAQAEWDQSITVFDQRCIRLSRFSMAQLFELTAQDSRNADFAAIVRTAGRPGLKARLLAYRERAKVNQAEPS